MKNFEKNEKEQNEKNKTSQINISDYNMSKVKGDEDISDNIEIEPKIIVIGDTAIGKTKIIQRFINEGEKFNENYSATIGFDVFRIKCKVKNIIINLNIWDTCGLIDFSACSPNLYKNASLAIVVYSIDNKKSFENLEFWINTLRQNSKPDILVFIVGSKSDLEDKREVKQK